MMLGIWSTLLSNYLKLLTGSLKMVGYSETIQGVAKVAFSFISGILTDKKDKTGGGKAKRQHVLWWSGWLSFLAMGVSILALYIDRDHKYPDPHWSPAYYVMVIALVLWGIFAGVYYPAMNAILADSVETGARTKLYTYRWMLQMATRAIGPLMAALLFQFVWGNTWKLDNVRNVFLAGIIGTSVPAMLLFFFDDSLTLGAVSEAVPNHSGGGSSSKGKGSKGSTRLLNEAQPLINTASDVGLPSTEADTTNVSNMCGCGTFAIPWLLAFSDLMFCLGQGMSVKYFFIYFQEVVLLSPTTTMVVSAIGTVAAALFSKASSGLAESFGRVQTLIVFRMGGVGSMVALGFFSHDASHPDACYNHNSTHHHNGTVMFNGVAHPEPWGDTFGPQFDENMHAHASVYDNPTCSGESKDPTRCPFSLWQIGVMALFVSQTGFFNSTQPLMKSILMDYVPKSTRGRWSAVDSLTSFGWSVTTIFGSMIVDKYCYSYLFYTTAGCMFLSQMPFWLMLRLVPVKEWRSQ